MKNWKSLTSGMNKSTIDCLSMLYKKEELSDVKLLVEGKCFSAHKCILAQRSNYFKILFSENKHIYEFELKDIKVEDFELILQCIYGIFPNFNDFGIERVLRLLKLSCSYLVKDMIMLAADFIGKRLRDANNFLEIFEVAVENSVESLMISCAEELSPASFMVITSEKFFPLSPKLVKYILSLDSLWVPEMMVFQAVQGWLNANPDCDSKQEILDQVRLERMSEDEILRTIWPSNLFPSVKLLQTLEQLKLHHDKRERGLILKDRNLCYGEHLKTKIFASSSSLPSAFMKFQNEFSRMAYVTIKFAHLYVINSIKINLLDRQPGQKIFIKLSYSSNVIELEDLDSVEWTDMEVYSLTEKVSVKKIIKATVMGHLRIIVYQNSGNPPKIREIKCKS